jgi:hypothetical protein
VVEKTLHFRVLIQKELAVKCHLPDQYGIVSIVVHRLFFLVFWRIWRENVAGTGWMEEKQTGERQGVRPRPLPVMSPSNGVNDFGWIMFHRVGRTQDLVESGIRTQGLSESLYCTHKSPSLLIESFSFLFIYLVNLG